MRVLPLLGVALLAACVSISAVKPGVTTGDEVRRLWGPPALELPNPDGSREMAYPQGYFTNQTFMVSVGRDGRVRDVRQALTDETFYRIQPGLTREELLRLIGPPLEVEDFARLQQTAWDYRFQDTWGYNSLLSVMIDRRGIVVGKSTRRLNDLGDRGP